MASTRQQNIQDTGINRWKVMVIGPFFYKYIIVKKLHFYRQKIYLLKNGFFTVPFFLRHKNLDELKSYFCAILCHCFRISVKQLFTSESVDIYLAPSRLGKATSTSVDCF